MRFIAMIISILFAVFLSCTIIDAEDCKYYETNDQKSYKYNLPRLLECVTRFEFSVRASHDVHIALSAQDIDLDPLYEIAIGGWKNSKSIIRRCKLCTNLATFQKSGIVDPNEYRSFLIQFVDGEIAVGYVGEVAFMTYNDPNPLDVNYVGYSTGYGSSGSWQFCDIGCDCGDDLYSLIPLSRDFKGFRVNTNLDFLTDSEYQHFLFTSNLSTNTFSFDIKMKKQNATGFKIKSTSTFDNTTEFETTFDCCNISVTYENGYIMMNRANGSTILQTKIPTSMQIYFWYGKNIQISECTLDLSNECSTENRYSDSTNKLIKVNCPMPDCNWKIKNNVFENCDANCTHKIANCTDYLAWYRSSDNATFDTWTQLQMPTDDNAHTQNRGISTGDRELTELQHVTQQYNTPTNIIGDNTNKIGDYVSRDNENTYNPISFGQQVMTALHTTGYLRTSHRLTQTTEKSIVNADIKSTEPQHVSQQYNTPTNIIGDNTNKIGDYVSRDKDNTDNSISFGQQVMTALHTTGYHRTSHLLTHTTETSTVNGIHWTTSIIVLMIFAGAVFSTFVIGCICVLHVLLKPRERRKVSPEGTTKVNENQTEHNVQAAQISG